MCVTPSSTVCLPQGPFLHLLLLSKGDSAVHTMALWWSKWSVKILNSVYPIVSSVQSLSRVGLFATP